MKNTEMTLRRASRQMSNSINSQPQAGNQAKDYSMALLKYTSLTVLTFQNAILILVMRYVRTRDGDMFMATTAVIMSEFFKLAASLAIIFLQEGQSVSRWLHHLHDNIVKQPMDCCKIAVPSIIYTLQNNLLYVAVSNLEAATFQVSYQAKILTTALFAVVMLGKPLSRLQWLALVFLFLGVGIVQLQPNDVKAAKVSTEQNPLLGFLAVVVSCFMSGFAGIYFEKILKGTKQSVWLRNVQLGFIGVVIGSITMWLNDGTTIADKGIFYGYDWVVWFVILLQSFGGLMVAVVVKYADNILKGFAASTAIVISCVASIYFFGFKPTGPFLGGASLVMSAVYMYSKFPYQPKVPGLPTTNPVNVV